MGLHVRAERRHGIRAGEIELATQGLGRLWEIGGERFAIFARLENAYPARATPRLVYDSIDTFFWKRRPACRISDTEAIAVGTDTVGKLVRPAL